MEQRRLEKPAVAELLKFLSFYGTRRFIARRIHSTPSHPIRLRFVLLLSSHLLVALPSGSCLQIFLPNICKHFFHLMYAVCPAHFIFLNLIIVIFDEDYKMWSSSLFSFLQPPVTSRLSDRKYSLQRTFLRHPQSVFDGTAPRYWLGVVNSSPFPISSLFETNNRNE
jgi:hypothetical protein